MSKFALNAFLAGLIILAYVVGPIALVWGWIRWTLRSKLRTLTSILSLSGFILATFSALLAAATMVYAQFHPFQFYDPVLLRIYRWGTLLSLGGLCFGIAGIWRKNSLRWHSPICALGMLAFWLCAAEGE